MIINLWNVHKMNADLKNLLKALPEGIILVNSEKQEVTLSNHEFTRLFGLPEQCSPEVITAKLGDKVLQTHSKLTGVTKDGRKPIDFDEDIDHDLLTISEAVSDEEGHLFKIVTSTP